MVFNKRIAAAVISLTTALSAAGCGTAASAANKDSSGNDGKKLSIVCTIFSEYDWAKEILGDKAEDAEITYLLDSGVDMHSYQPTADDILKISTCDIFIYVGGESEEWAEDAVNESRNKDLTVIRLMDVLGDNAKEEELKEGMQGEEEEEEGEEHEEHEDDDEGHHHKEGETEYDEHVWLSLTNAKLFCGEIEKALEEKDAANAETYKANLESYTAKLDSLNNDFSTLIKNAGDVTLIFGDRFPFRYFTDDYNIDYYAAFIGCSAETEASFETIAFLAEKADELNADTIYTIENSDGRIAQSIIDATKNKDQKITALNSVQSVSKDMIDSGTTYLSLMQENYDTLKASLS